MMASQEYSSSWNGHFTSASSQWMMVLWRQSLREGREVSLHAETFHTSITMELLASQGSIYDFEFGGDVENHGGWGLRL